MSMLSWLFGVDRNRHAPRERRSPLSPYSSIPAMVQVLEPRVLLSGTPPTISVAGGLTSASISTYHDSPATCPDGTLVEGSDADGDPIQLQTTADPQHGTVTIDADDNLTYTPNAQYVGSDSFSVCFVDVDGSSDSVAVSVAVTNSGPGLSTNGSDPQAAEFSGYHDESISSDGSYLNTTDSEGDPIQLGVQANVSHGTLTFNSQDGSFNYTPDSHWAGEDSFVIAATDALGAPSTNAVTVLLNVSNSPPNPGNDGDYNSVGGDVVRVSISDLLANDSDPDEPINPATFTLASVSLDLKIRRVGDQLLITPPMPELSDPPKRYTFTYTLTDSVGATGTGTVGIPVMATSLHDAWIATINREEAKHIGYRYYGDMNLPTFFNILRNNADLVEYEFGSSGSATAVYSPFWNKVTVATGTTVLDTTTVIHESVHIVDDFSGWYLSDSGVTWNLSAAESLAWAAQELFASTALGSLRSFEDAVFDGSPHTEAFVTNKWDGVIVAWSGLQTSTYTYPYGTYNIGESGWADFFGKFGLSGLGAVSQDYKSAMMPLDGYIPLNSMDSSGTHAVSYYPFW